MGRSREHALGGQELGPGPPGQASTPACLCSRSLKPSVPGAWPQAGACWSGHTLMLGRTGKGSTPAGVPSSALGRVTTLLPVALMMPPRFEINFLSETGDIAFHIKPRFSSVTMVGNAFQGGRWGQEEVSSIFPLVLGEPFEVMGAGASSKWVREACGGCQPPTRQGEMGLVGLPAWGAHLGGLAQWGLHMVRGLRHVRAGHRSRTQPP